MPLRSEHVLEDIAALATVDDERTRRYVAALDAGMEGIFKRAGDRLPSQAYFDTGDPRSITEGAGYMAFFHAFPRSRFHRDPRLAAGVKEVIADVLRCQLDTGELAASGEAGVERPGRFPPHPYSSHGQSWYLEPLLFAMNWLGAEFTPEERERINRAFYRTADFICARPIYQVNNRSVIQCAILAMCGRYFREERFLREAIRHFHTMPIQVFDKISGQILEGSAPDGNYAGTTFEYLYIYRIMSGDVDIDRQMVAALKWLARVVDCSGVQLYCGVATRVPINNRGMVYDYLPALERYSAEEPHFQRMIEQYLPRLTASGALGSEGHSISPAIWALLEHQSIAPPAEAPAWYSDVRAWYHRDEVGPEHFVYNEGYDSLYFPVRRAYSTCVAVRGRPPMKDLQCWSYQFEPPVIYPAATYPFDDHTCRASTVRAWGLDTARTGASGCQMTDACWVAGEVPGLIVRYGKAWRFYVFAPRATFVITDGEMERFEVDWVVDTAVCGTPEADDRTLSYPGRAGRLCYAGPAPQRLQDDQVLTFRFAYDKPPVWHALCDQSFALISAGPGTVAFSDAEGTYGVRYDIGPRVRAEGDYRCFTLKMFDRLVITRSAPPRGG